MKIQEQMNAIQTSLNSLGEDVSALEALLNPILIAPTNIAAEPPSTPADGIELCQHGQELHQNLVQIKAITKNVRSLLERLAF